MGNRDDKLYVNTNAYAMELLDKDRPGNIRAGATNWPLITKRPLTAQPRRSNNPLARPPGGNPRQWVEGQVAFKTEIDDEARRHMFRRVAAAS